MEQKEDLPTNQENKVEITKKEPEKKEETKNPLRNVKPIQNEPDKILLNKPKRRNI